MRQGRISKAFTGGRLQADIKKPASGGGLCVTAIRRALTHHSMNDANNQRNTDVEAVHAFDLR
ncbi:protein of unknown function [Paraburkholderia dioscoreae]|uniref:Uncharacterized protein n=1 Tax=Paraburkholderia dioscoreae TaxID=2604047 RepID=A0A5Q4ZLS3_9BURK|nr:protein of unknown function [Paraburkholderia dioscoreae]